MVKLGEASGVQSIVAAPSNPDRVYMATGDNNLRYTRLKFGAVYVSDNRGESWRRSEKTDWYMQPNGHDQRLRGERLAVDPANADVVFYGSHEDGLWISSC